MRNLIVRGRLLWVVAILAWAASLLATAARAESDIGIGNFRFSWGQVCVLVAIGAAWGDLRGQVRSNRERIENIERKRRTRR